MLFADLGLADALLRAVHEQGYTTPTAVQAQAIPVILEGRDVLAGAQTGTGKTAGFTLPLLQRLAQSTANAGQGKFRPVRALILTPTRELAAQISDSVQTYGKYLPLRSNVVFGGVKIAPQIHKLRRGVDVLVATPGRLLDLVNQRVLDLSQVEILVLDEADRMLDMGFLPSIKKITALLPAARQNLMFSATYSRHISQLAGSILRSPVTIEVASRNSAAETVSHLVHPVDQGRKRALLSFLIGSNNWQQVLVFTKTKRGAERLAKQLTTDGLRSTAIHGNKTQAARSRALADFKQGGVRVLVATDVAARGLDIDRLSHVVNFELPLVAEDYIHRIGRTGRAGNDGAAISLVAAEEKHLLRGIELLLKKTVQKEVISGYEPGFSISAAPKNNGPRGGARRKQQTAPRSADGAAPNSRQRAPKHNAGPAGHGQRKPKPNAGRRQRARG